MPDVNVALIGYAFMGRAHSNAYRQVTRFFSPQLRPRLKVLCGRTPSKVAAAARQLGWEQTSTDWEEIVRRPDIDIVDVGAPGDSHAEIAIAAARAGKVVFCEKPLANTVKEAERMLAAVERAGVLHMICHNYRRAPAVMLAKELISRGDLGEIRHYRGTYLQDWITDPKFPLVWRLDRRQAGSGALGDIAAHSIDLARFLVGEIVSVAGHLETFIRKRPLPGNPRKTGRVTVDDAATSLVRFKSGAMGTIEATRMALGRKNHNRFEINGSLRQRGVRSRTDERARVVPRIRTTGDAWLPPDPGDGTGSPLHQGVVAAGPHHRLRAHVHAYCLRFAARDGRGSPSAAKLPGRRAQSAGHGRDREGLENEALGGRSTVMRILR